jgi:putative IMPACT (imprinted ancient) family translation regulator
LGVGGLIQAYTQTAQETVKRAVLVQKEILDEVVISFSYEQTSLISYLLQKYEGTILAEEYGEQVKQKLHINRGLREAFKKELFDKSKGNLTIS